MKPRELFKAERVPVLQNKMFADQGSALACPHGDVRLVQDLDTGLIFNAAFDASLLTYDAQYQNEQACSVVFQRHLEGVREIIHRHFQGKTLLEVGCGKGYFLSYLRQAGYEISGVDPAYEGDNPWVRKAYFDASLGLSADGIVLRHVLEHMADPLAFLRGIAEANGGGGMVYIEVPCFDWICARRAWFDICYEHVNYFRRSDFPRMFGTVRDSGHFFGGQYQYVVADLATLRSPCFDRREAFSMPSDFLSDIERLAARATGRRRAIWGSGAKGVMFALYMKRAGVTIDFIIDINPAKQGRYIAGSGLPVVSPQDGLRCLQAGDDIFVMNSNYLDEIVDAAGGQYHYLLADHGREPS